MCINHYADKFERLKAKVAILTTVSNTLRGLEIKDLFFDSFQTQEELIAIEIFEVTHLGEENG